MFFTITWYIFSKTLEEGRAEAIRTGAEFLKEHPLAASWQIWCTRTIGTCGDCAKQPICEMWPHMSTEEVGSCLQWKGK